jgi:hypothetical protein
LLSIAWIVSTDGFDDLSSSFLHLQAVTPIKMAAMIAALSNVFILISVWL